MQPIGLNPAGGARAVLASATRDVHERLHRVPAFDLLLAGELSRDAYARLLRCLYGFHQPLEAMLRSEEHLALVHPAPLPAARAHRLESDMLALGMTTAEIEALPRARFPALPTPGHYLGALYVREGSTLGARLMSRALDRLFGPGEGGRAFLTGSPDDGRAWQACCARIERAAAQGHLEEMVASARDTFGVVADWIEMQS